MNSDAQVPAILQFLPIIVVFVVFYFLLIRPQQKRQKDHAQMLSKLDKNDEILTAGGIYGTVVAVNDKKITLRIADNVKVDVEKSYVTQVTKSRQSGA